MIYKDLPAPARSNKQVQEYVAAVKKGAQGQFVLRTHQGWMVRPAYRRTQGMLYATKQEALATAESQAERAGGSVFVFDANGSLMSVHEP